MPLNYSKWDQLELSDDSDIEGHPNVDKRSLIRWKQRDIHEKRGARNARLGQLEADLAVNGALEPRVVSLLAELRAAADVPVLFQQRTEQFKVSTDDARPAPGVDTFAAMLYALLLAVYKDVKDAGVDKDDAEALGKALPDALAAHLEKLRADSAAKRKEIAELEEEKKKKITSEDVHEGFDSKYVPAKPEPAPLPGAVTEKQMKKIASKKTEVEVLNPKSVAAGPSSSKPSAAPAADDDEEEDTDDDDAPADLPQMTATLTEFSELPYGAFERSYRFIQAHRDAVVPGASDALLVAAFTAQSEGRKKHAKQCVHQSLLLQYCEKLGGDGVRVFFQKMIAGDQRATGVFLQDVEQTYTHLCTRVAAAKEEEAALEAAGGGGAAEQIQLVAEGGDAIGFNVPDGPPPADLRLEGEGTEDLDVEEVRKMLQMRWDVFQTLSPPLQDALKTNELEKVNAVLGAMTVDDATAAVEKLDMAHILNFAEGGVRDETGKGPEAAADT